MESFTRDLNAIVKEARLLAIDYSYNYIHTNHFFTAMLKKDCEAHPYLAGLHLSDWEKKLEEQSPNVRTTIYDSLPLTVEAESMVTHAIDICAKVNKRKTSTIHLLLSLVSYQSVFAKQLKKEGLVFEDIVKDHFDVPLRSFPPPLEMPELTHYPRFLKPFISKTLLKEKASGLYNRAYQFFTYQQFEQCIQICDAGLKLVSTDKNFGILKAWALVEWRRFPEALIALTNLLASDPGNESFRISLAHCYGEIGDHELAHEIYDAVLKKDPRNATALNNMGFVLARQGRYEASVPYYEKAIEAEPGFAYPYDNLGYAKYKIGFVDEGLALIDHALELDKGNSFAYKYKGIIYSEQHNNAEALRHFELALKYGFTMQYGDEVSIRMKEIYQSLP